jgi:hypothetical protein
VDLIQEESEEFDLRLKVQIPCICGISNCLSGVVISAENLEFKFLRYIAEHTSFELMVHIEIVTIIEVYGLRV